MTRLSSDEKQELVVVIVIVFICSIALGLLEGWLNPPLWWPTW